MKLTLNSRVGELYAHPIGRDIVEKLLLSANKPRWLVSVAGNLRLRTVLRFAGLFAKKSGALDAALFESVLKLLNSEQDEPRTERIEPAHKWWKEAVFYQIYPRSFAKGPKDSDSKEPRPKGAGPKGAGSKAARDYNLRGIISKLDYLKELGVDAVWLSPIYDSPEDDNGYDIRDYRAINSRFGTMADFDALLAALHERGMKLIMDLVINHTSDEHLWFREALKSKDSPYRDYYIFREGTSAEDTSAEDTSAEDTSAEDTSAGGIDADSDSPPNNWASFFGGAAWEKAGGDWYLHLFSKKQPDLNWENADMRRELYEMVRWWLAKGVDGFRLDVINLISKADGLPDGNPVIGEGLGPCGIEHYFYGPRLHRYLKELRREAFAPYGAATVGETPGIGIMAGRLLTDEYRGELDMIFSFDHLENPGYSKFDEYKYDLEYLKRFYISHLNADLGHGWHTLFFNNHDNPRMISKIDSSGEFHGQMAKMLAVFQMTLRGTPFIYQGEELGAANGNFTCMADLQDIESHGKYSDFLAAGMSEEEAFAKILAGTRDHARIPIDWREAERQTAAPDSVYGFYRRLAAMRKKSLALRYGKLEFLHERKRGYFGYTRKSGSEQYYIEANLTAKPQPSLVAENFEFVLGNYEHYHEQKEFLWAYEVRVFWRTR